MTLPPPTAEPTKPGNGGPKPTATPEPTDGDAATDGGIVPGALFPLAVPMMFLGLGRLLRPNRRN